VTVCSLPRSITPAERQVVEQLWADKRVREIARLSGVHVATIRSQIRSVAAKLPNPHGLPAVKLIRSFDPANIERAVE
jgi:DNA-binding CsgD family transcriptional regulator